MKMCVTSTGATLDAPVDPRFGRCQYFVIVDSETMELEAIPNSSIGASSGAGIQAAQTVADKGVGVVITGNVGPNATQTLGAANIKIVTGARSGTVREAIEEYKSGKLQQTEVPTTPAYSGMDSSAVAGIGAGMGGGRGMWRGGGRGGGGRGGGRGMGMGFSITSPEPLLPAQTKDEEIQDLESQMKNIKARLDELKK
jgi:predicted Fe-Mo cluster-binding NifX family protein